MTKKQQAKLNRFRNFLHTNGLTIAVARDTTDSRRDYVACIVCPREVGRVVKTFGGHSGGHSSTQMFIDGKPTQQELLSHFSEWLSLDCEGLRIGNRRIRLP